MHILDERENVYGVKISAFTVVILKSYSPSPPPPPPTPTLKALTQHSGCLLQETPRITGVGRHAFAGPLMWAERGAFSNDHCPVSKQEEEGPAPMSGLSSLSARRCPHVGQWWMEVDSTPLVNDHSTEPSKVELSCHENHSVCGRPRSGQAGRRHTRCYIDWGSLVGGSVDQRRWRFFF